MIEQFEKWHKSKYHGYHYSKLDNGDYAHERVNLDYGIWLAAVEHCNQGEHVAYMDSAEVCCLSVHMVKELESRGNNIPWDLWPTKLFTHAMPKSDDIEKYLQEVHEVRHCDYCHHVGIDDSAKGMASCASCGWSGDEPKADICPACEIENHMMATCPKCNEQYGLVEYVSTDTTPQPSTNISDLQLESFIENSDGHWVEDEFRLNGTDLMNLLRAIAKHTVK